MNTEPSTKAGTIGRLYLDLLKRSLTRYGFERQTLEPVRGERRVLRLLFRPIRAMLERRGLVIARRRPFDAQKRAEGRDWPRDAETMIGLKRLDNIEALITEIVARGVAGDVVETGVWRGGACIFMRAVLRVLGDESRNVWLCDSFRGLPMPDPRVYPHDEGDTLWSYDELAVPVEQVRANFEHYGLLDDRVRFVEGWFRDALPTAPIEQVSLLRLDGDMYESTMDALKALYPKVSVGGFVIVDDFGVIPACRRAVTDFRLDQGIEEEVVPVDWTAVYWQRQR